MKAILLLLTLVTLSGCAGIAEHHVSYLQSKCAISGFERGTTAHSQCYQEESSLWWDQAKTHQL